MKWLFNLLLVLFPLQRENYKNKVEELRDILYKEIYGCGITKIKTEFDIELVIRANEFCDMWSNNRIHKGDFKSDVANTIQILINEIESSFWFKLSKFFKSKHRNERRIK